MFMYHF